MSNYKNVCVCGLGYIGLPTAALLANRGYQVLGVDISQSVVDTVNSGGIHIIEPELDTFVHSAVRSGKLKAALEPAESDVFIVAVPTPLKQEESNLPVPSIDHVLAATRSISRYLRPGNLVILESTSPVGTTQLMVETLRKEGVDTNVVYFAHCPERVLPGKVMRELIENDRIVGGITAASTEKAVDFYKQFVTGEVLATDSRTAEFAKLAENSFRDVNIAFANELSIICDKLDINVWRLIALANRHPRVNILQPGPGVGGHCIAVDPWFIVDSAPESSKLIQAARFVNQSKPDWVVNKVLEKAGKFRRASVACLGLAFKADIDDLRESPATSIVEDLVNLNVADILVVEPNIDSHSKFELHEVEAAINKADIVLLLVDHKQFRALPESIFREKILIDTRGCFES